MKLTTQLFWQAFVETIIDILQPIRKLMGFGERESREVSKNIENSE